MTTVSVPRPGRVPVLGTLLFVSLVTGLLAAAAAFPFVAAFGLAAKAGAESFKTIPAELEETPLPQASRILAADGTTLAVVYFNENRVLVPLAQVPAVMRNAVIAIEDERYYEHNGVDVRGVTRALVENSRAGTVQQGGSTITQQYVKNVLIESATDEAGRKRAVERSATRKLREARLALALERRYSKDEILEKYLNIAYFGNGVYGVGTAAQHYFSVPVSRLTAAQAALLAGLVKNPSAYDPVRHPEAAKVRRDLVLSRMEALGHLAPEAAAAARRTPVRLRVSAPPGLEDNPHAPYFLDYLRTQILDDPDGVYAPIFGETQGERAQKLFQGGLVIRTTLDFKLQRAAQASLRATLNDPRDPAGAAVVVEPGTGRILAMAGVNHDKVSRKVNLATGGASGFQAGSTFKPFVLAAAIEQGIPLSLTLRAPQTYRSNVFQNYENGVIKPYEVSNAGDSDAGVFNLVTASWRSVNTYYIQLEERTGLDRPAQIAEAMGVRSFPVRRVPSLVLGANEVSPLDMAAAFAAFSNHGVWCRPLGITEVRRATDGRTVGRTAPLCRRAIDADVADTVTSILRGVLTNGTGTRANFGRPAAGKTGTTNGPTAAWFTGFTPQRAATVWVGYARDPAKRLLRNIKGLRNVYGGTLPAQVWRETMTVAHEGLPVENFDRPAAVPKFGPLTGGPSPSASPGASESPKPKPTRTRDDDGDRKCRKRRCPSPTTVAQPPPPSSAPSPTSNPGGATTESPSPPPPEPSPEPSPSDG